MTGQTEDGARSARTHLIEVLLEGSSGQPLERPPSATEAAIARLAWLVMLDVAVLLLAAGVLPSIVEEIHRQVWASCEGAPWLDLLRVVASVHSDRRELEGTER